MKQNLLQTVFAVLLCASANAQVNSGSNGSDGAFNPTTNIVINMADHPNGIYQYTSVNISNGVTVFFIPNANNTPVTWLVQSNCVIDGYIIVSGQDASATQGGIGGPGGSRGGNGGSSTSSGQGLGGGSAGNISAGYVSGGNASYGNLGQPTGGGFPAGSIYGNAFLIPLLGGSGGGGSDYNVSAGGGGGGGGAVLIATSGDIVMNGYVYAFGGHGGPVSGNNSGGSGSGGAVRLITQRIIGTGTIHTGGSAGLSGSGGSGRVRFDTYENNFSGQIIGVFSQGFQPIIIPAAGQGAQLTVTSVGGVPVSALPTGALSTPDAVLSAQQNNPISIVVHCANIPLNTQITVSVKPASGATVSATGLNSTGTLSSSTATVSIVMPRGGGLIYAIAATGN